MKRVMMFVTLLSLMSMAGFASAQTSVTTGATSGSVATANNGGSAGAMAQTGPINLSTGAVTTGAVTVTPTQQTTTGAVTLTPTQQTTTGAVTVTPNNVTNVEIKGGDPTKIPVGVPGAVAPGIPSAQIFGGLNQPTTVTGIPLILEYLDRCAPVATRGNELRDEFAKGASGKTQIVFSPNQDYKGKATSQKVETVRVSFPKKAGTYTCLGVITVMTKKGEPNVPFTTIISDARIYPLREMEGYEHVTLLSVRDAIAVAVGVTTAGSGFSVSPGITSAAVSLLSLGTLSGGYSNGSAGTYADAAPGDTFLVLSPSADGVVVDPGQIRGSYRPVVQAAASDNGKKMEAAK